MLFQVIFAFCIGVLVTLSSWYRKQASMNTNLLLSPNVVYSNGTYWLNFEVNEVKSIDGVDLPNVAVNGELDPYNRENGTPPETCLTYDELNLTDIKDDTIDKDIHNYTDISYLLHACENKICKVQKVKTIETLYMDENVVSKLLPLSQPISELGMNIEEGSFADLCKLSSTMVPSLDKIILFDDINEDLDALWDVFRKYKIVFISGVSVIIPAIIISSYAILNIFYKGQDVIVMNENIIKSFNELLTKTEEIDNGQCKLRLSIIDFNKNHIESLNSMKKKLMEFKNEIYTREKNMEQHILDAGINYATVTLKKYAEIYSTVSQLSDKVERENEKNKFSQTHLKEFGDCLETTEELYVLMKQFIIHTIKYLEYFNRTNDYSSSETKHHLEVLKMTFESLHTLYRILRNRPSANRSMTYKNMSSYLKDQIGGNFYTDSKSFYIPSESCSSSIHSRRDMTSYGEESCQYKDGLLLLSAQSGDWSSSGEETCSSSKDEYCSETLSGFGSAGDLG